MLSQQGFPETAIVLANRWFQPLTHVSSGGFPRVSALLVNREEPETRGGQRFAVAQETAQFVATPFRSMTAGGNTLTQSIGEG